MNLFQYFNQSCKKHAKKTALFVDGEKYSYEKLDQCSNAIANALENINDKNSFVGFLAHRSITAFSSVLGILRTGKGYLPLNPKFPLTRNSTILELSNVGTLIIGKEALSAAIPFLMEYKNPLNLILTFQKRDFPAEILTNENFRFYELDFSKSFQKNLKLVEQQTSEYAYLLFTSGSTGIPKGVPITHNNVCAYVNYVLKRYPIEPGDRFSQTFDLTFDLSVHDMFVCWATGAGLYCIPEESLIGPAKFIIKHELTHWFSVPSLAVFMNRFKMLKPNAFPSLKVSLFCGEPFPEFLINLWAKAASNSILENIYGPTEATIGISHYRCDTTNRKKNKALNGITSIGSIFDSQAYRIVDENNQEIKQGETGELCLSGTQVTTQYWNNNEATEKSFVKFRKSGKLWYKTGDLVVQDEDGNIYYKSRKDSQVQIRGHRVELDEINHNIRKFSQTDIVVAIPYPIVNGIAENVYVFVHHTSNKDQSEIINYCKKMLPDYMVPKKVIIFDDFPLNANGKISNTMLYEILKTKIVR